MSLPVFLKSKTFLVLVFVGTLALGTFSVVGAYLIKKGAGRQETAKAQTPNTCPSFQINPASAAANWPNLITVTTQLYLNCSQGQNYDLAYLVQQTNPAGPRFKTEPSGSSHTKPCGSEGIVADTFEIKKENLKDYNTGAPAVPTCANPPCDYKIYLRWSSGSEDPWKDHSSCQANFQITSGLSCTLVANPPALSPGQTTTLTVTGAGGTSPYTFHDWEVTPSGGTLTPPAQPSGTQATWQAPATLTAETTYTASVSIKDSQQRSATCQTTLTVTPGPTAPTCTSLTLNKTSAAVNEEVQARASAQTNSETPFASDGVQLWAGTQAELEANILHGIGNFPCPGTSCTNALLQFTPTSAKISSPATYKMFMIIKDEAGTVLCSDNPKETVKPDCGCGVKELTVTAVTAPPTCKGFTLNKTQAKDTEEVTASLTLNSGSSAFVDKVFLHAATAEELSRNVLHNLGPISFFKDKSGDQTTTYIFKPQTFQVSGGANKVWVSAENAQGQICTDRPGGYQNRPACGCEVKTLAVTVCPTCQGIQMTPAAGTVSAGSPITFVATFKRGSEPSPTISFKITKPGGAEETITCPKVLPECTITTSGDQIVATLKYLPATAGQYLAKALASCGGGSQ